MIKMTDDEAILHLTYITIPKVYNKTEKDKVALKMATDALDRPQPKKGKWIRITNGAMREIYICSECGRQIEGDGIDSLMHIRYPYCHCGAKMEVD